MSQKRPALFRGRHFEDVVILLCVRWYLRYSLSYRDLQEMMAERGLSIDHVTIWRWVQRYAPVLNQRIRRELRRPNRSWRVDETYVKVAGNWAYLYRAVDSAGATIRSVGWTRAMSLASVHSSTPSLALLHSAVADQLSPAPGLLKPICNRTHLSSPISRH